MAVPKVCGIETEFGIQHLGGDGNPVASSSLLVNAYVGGLARAGWDFEDEQPGNDARGFAREGALPPEVETHLVNAVLTNGARYYVDHAHPEYSTPECPDALELVRYDRAGEEILRRSMRAAAQVLPPGQRIVVYKNNSDGKGNSYGCHENYLMDRAVPFSRIARQVMAHFVTRQVFCGAGKVGTETPQAGADVPYQLSQRAEFFEEEVGLETTLKRPIVNTRDEPHADPQRYRRLHVIVGDANLCEVATFLKVGTTAFVLAMIEDEALGSPELVPANPVQAIRQVAADPSLRATIDLTDGRRISALGVQWELLERAVKYAEDQGLGAVGGEAVGRDVLRRWEEVLHGLETDPAEVAGQVDWCAKLQLIEAYRDRHGLDWDDQRLAALDLQYHDLRPERSLFQRLPTEHLVSEEAVLEAVGSPPRGTRAYFRGQCLARWASAITSANWDSLVFDLGTDPLRRVPMMDPLRGTAEHVGALLDACATPAQLVARLSGRG
ncbi:depupylase/deamidase Dop [Aciditerrimonas ferrireducens]|uniref:Depupylase/deamidase Dop n=1 Tax=Aciditerrimonas ferrireducens TaxID=667306 RepID=A0ABV6C234_9ACTN